MDAGSLVCCNAAAERPTARLLVRRWVDNRMGLTSRGRADLVENKPEDKGKR
jgi:hypothetical protein